MIKKHYHDNKHGNYDHDSHDNRDNHDNHNHDNNNHDHHHANHNRYQNNADTGQECTNTTGATPSNGNRHIENAPEWLKTQHNDGGSKNYSKSKRQRLFVVYGSVLNVRFGSSDENEIDFAVNCDSCAVMNVANELLHMWIMTTYPEIVHKYERYDDVVAFQPITLDCAIPISDAKKDKGKLLSIVTYKTRYCKKDGTMMTLSF